MCNRLFRIGYKPCVREEAIDLLMEGHKRGAVAKRVGVTWPTIRTWLAEYQLAEHEITQYLASSAPEYRG